ncbi:DUF4229 domain-containing protein [Actinobacteria bacterium YIM 96077]|uniref:DUF4229 domain-containing protein n=1 Tax=Phytoactinopolyspora halophila TaxID=1981511 RepID=A0A329QLE0_9ACTN|nr:DUF4229 domain-containing protein [Actinobacteria bacterium YIM 96077]RAW13073.1 hypothetical protein DPM12_13425 [Phytoactinopolyspora halophila]
MAVLRYTALRAGILVVVGALLWLVGLRGFWLVLTAIFFSGVISIFVLRSSRDAVSAALDRRVSTIKQRLDEHAAAEDAWDEATRQSPEAERDEVQLAERESEGEQGGEEQPGHAGSSQGGDEADTAGAAHDRKRAGGSSRDGQQGESRPRPV